MNNLGGKRNHKSWCNPDESRGGGFTLIEIIVAVAIFTVVITISTGSLLAIIDANQKSRATQTVIDNLNFALEEISRQVRIGSRYHCGDKGNPGESVGDPEASRDCSNGGYYLAFLSSTADTIEYRINGQRIEKAVNEGGFEAITSPSILVDSFVFYVRNTSDSDNQQPQVIITASGSAAPEIGEEAEFNLQTTITQRLLDS